MCRGRVWVLCFAVSALQCRPIALFCQVLERNSSSRDDEVAETSAMFELQAAADVNAHLSTDPLPELDLSDFFAED